MERLFHYDSNPIISKINPYLYFTLFEKYLSGQICFHKSPTPTKTNKNSHGPIAKAKKFIHNMLEENWILRG